MSDNLPPLPPACGAETLSAIGCGYTEDDMQAYARAALAEAAQSLPDGWKLVPVEPTPEMVAAYLAENSRYWHATDQFPPRQGKWRTGTASEATRESYRAMIAASPAQPVRVLRHDGRAESSNRKGPGTV